MYLLTWNAEQKTIHAGLGGVVTAAEGVVLSEELTQLLESHGRPGLTVELDASRATRFADGAFAELEKLRFVCARMSATLELITEERDLPASANVQAILDGPVQERYATRLSA